ncbi:MAG: phage tail tape measure protein [Prevotellaceae bacterium]|nr:phage tail tape measure protein [Candidatus Faecinaster equi]
MSSGQIITNVGKVAATMAAGNTDFEQTLGLITAITTQTRNASKAANALKTIGQRIRGVGEDAEQGLTASLQGLFDEYGIGIQIMDSATGEMESTYNILAAMAEKWDSLTDAQRQNLGETAAGKNRITEFNALMSGFNTTLDATKAAYDSAGVTAQQFAVYQDSIEGKLNSLKEAWQELVTEGGTINKFIKLVLDAGTAVLKFADSDIGQLIIKTTAFIGVFKLSKSIMLPALTKIGQGFADLIGKITFAIIQGEKLSSVLGFLGSAILPAALVGLAAFALHLEKIKDPAYQVEQTINDIKNRIQETNDTISQLEAAGADESILGMYRQQAEDLNKELEKAEENLFHVRNANFRVASGATEPQDIGAGIGGYNIQWDTTNRVQQTIDKYNEAQKSVKDYEQAVLDGKASEEDYINALEEQAEARQDLIDIYSEFQDNEENLTATEREEYQQLQALLQRLGYLKDNTSTTAQEFSNLADSEGSVADTTRQVLNSLAEENSQMISNWNSMQDLVAAETQLRNGQKLSETQIQQLIAKYPALRSQIDAMRNGELAAANAIHAVGVQSLGTSKTVIANSKKEADAAVASAEKEVDAAKAKIQALMAVKQASGVAVGAATGALLAPALAALREAKAAQALYSDAVYYGTEVTAGNTGATSSNTSATEKNTNAIRESTQALKDQTEAIKNAADYMVDKIDEQIDVLEDSKDAINKYYDDWIERLQDTNSELEDQIELENALRKLAEAKSKQVRVYRDGGFAYVSDTQAVAEAQREASTLQRQKEQEDLIAQLEKAREKDLASVDKQIDAWEKEKQTWEDASKSYDNYLATQALGIDQEGKNWSKRLGQAKTYTSDYLKLMQAIDDVESGRKTPAQGQQVITSVSSDIRNLPTSTSALKGQINTSSPISAYTPVENVIRTDTSGNTVINVANITLPNVENPTDFIADLQDFARYASQSAGNR